MTFVVMKVYTSPPSLPIVEDLMVQYGLEWPNLQDSADRVKLARDGVKFKQLLEIASNLHITLSDLSHILHVSLRTLQRYSDEKLLDPDTSSKAIRLATLYHYGLSIFGDHIALAEWLHTDLPALNGESPVHYLDTPFGFDEVQRLLGRIAHGIYS